MKEEEEYKPFPEEEMNNSIPDIALHDLTEEEDEDQTIDKLLKSLQEENDKRLQNPDMIVMDSEIEKY